MGSRRVAVVVASLVAAASAGWATVWRDHPSGPAPVPPIEIASDDGSIGGEDVEDPVGADEKDGGEHPDVPPTTVGGGGSDAADDDVGGIEPARNPQRPTADDDRDDGREDPD
jgi:hypothetical protein